MKKIFTIAMVFTLVAAFSLPAMAETKFSFKGAYRVRGFMLSNPGLQADQAAVKASSSTLPITAEGEGPSQSWLDMRFRMQSQFTVSERLSVVTRFDALDNKKYGYNDDDTKGGACPSRNSNIDFDRAYMVIKADFGTFKIGRMGGEAYGNDFLDSGTERDRISFDTKMDKWVLGLIYEKQKEQDTDDCKGLDILTDADYDIYYAVAAYKSEDLEGGVQVGFGFDKSKSDNIVYDPTGGFGTAAEDDTIGYDRDRLSINPYLDAGFGDFGVNAEALMLFGKYKEFDRDCYIKGMNNLDTARKKLGLSPQPDIDYDAYAWNIEGTWSSVLLVPKSVMCGLRVKTILMTTSTKVWAALAQTGAKCSS